MVTMSASGDEVEILVYDYYAMMNTTGSDMVTVTLSNLPSTLAGKDLFLTHFRVDETHSNPYSIWTSQGSPTAPTEAQWQAMKAHQQLELLQPVSKATVTTTYTIPAFTIPRQAGSLIILGVNRPVTGRNALVEIEGEDYDGQSGATKEDSNDTGVGQSIAVGNGGYLFFNNVDFSDAGVGAVQLRVNAQSATTLQLRADSQTGTLLGTCQVAATGGSWATQTCTLTQTTGVHTLYVVFGGSVRLNYMKFQQATSGTGTGGMAGGGVGGRDAGGGVGGVTGAGAGGSSSSGNGGAGIGGFGAGGGVVSGLGGSDVSGSGGAGPGGSGSGGNAGSGGSALSGGGGCGCDVGNAGRSSETLLIFGLGLVATVSVLRRRRAGPRR
jgi:MYXO-CTERM domain-containing protein